MEGIGDDPLIELSPARQGWYEYSTEAYDWLVSEKQNARLASDGTNDTGTSQISNLVCCLNTGGELK